MRQLLEYLSKKYCKPFIWKFIATLHGKGVIDGVGGKVKSSVWRKVMSLSKDRPVVQDSQGFAKLAAELCHKTKVNHFFDTEIQDYKEIGWFRGDVPVNGIFDMHVDGSGW